MGSQETPPRSQSVRPSLIQSPTQASHPSSAPNQVLSSLASTGSAEQVAAPLKLWKICLIVFLLLGLAVLVSVLIYLQIHQDDHPPQVAFSTGVQPTGDAQRASGAESAKSAPPEVVESPANATAKIVDEAPSIGNAAQASPEQTQTQPKSDTNRSAAHDPMLDSTKEELVNGPTATNSLGKQELALPMLNANQSTTPQTPTPAPSPTSTSSTSFQAVKPQITKVDADHSFTNVGHINSASQEKPASLAKPAILAKPTTSSALNASPKLNPKPNAKPNVKPSTDRDVDLVSALVSNDIEPSDASEVKAADKNGPKARSQLSHHPASVGQDAVESQFALCKEKSFLERELCYVQMCTKLGGKHPDCYADQPPASIPGVNK